MLACIPCRHPTPRARPSSGEAFTPLSEEEVRRKRETAQAGWVTGVESTLADEDLLCCTPGALMGVIDAVLRAHEEMTRGERKTLTSEAARLMSPEVGAKPGGRRMPLGAEPESLTSQPPASYAAAADPRTERSPRLPFRFRARLGTHR